jgi:uncharacterized NAD(P)/FAD-binding protein YdhS
MARGKAYADREFPYLLNVPAGRMSATPNAPLEFLSFAQKRVPNATADDFLPRTVYGEYLESTLLDAELSAPAHVRLDRLRGEVCAVEKMAGSSSVHVQLADGRDLIADDVVLALGNPQPGHLPGTQTVADSPGYIHDPWSAPLKVRPGENVLLLGTGLTMADMATAAAAASNNRANIFSISRHGLVPPSQTAFRPAACQGDSAAMLRAASFSARTLLRSVRELAQDTERRGGDWREAVTFIRNIAPALWQRLPLRERRRMLRHVRPYWDVHRHRLPNETLARLGQLRQQRKLHIHAGRLLSFEPVGDQIRVTWRPRGSPVAQTLIVDRVVNCTGPNYNARHSSDPLMRSLLAQGLAVPDALNLGLRTGPHGALIDATGHAAAHLFYVGPMLRADYWEATAAQELRAHAEGLASHLAAPAGQIRVNQGA